MDENGEIFNALNLLKSYEMDNNAQDNEKPEKKKYVGKNESAIRFPAKLADTSLETKYIGLLLNEIKAISVFNFVYDECFFEDEMLLNIYKKILFTDGEKYAPNSAKEKFNFSKESQELYEIKNELREEFEDSDLKLEDVYRDLRKIFILRKHYLRIPVKEIQTKIADIMNYELYDQMSPEDVEDAVMQVTATEKFKRSILNKDLTKFIIEGDNTLTNGLDLPFPILTSAFKGIRQGETAAFAMPSNYGKSRFTINLATYIAVVHQKKF